MMAVDFWGCFRSVKGDVSVTIAGTVCDVNSVSPTQITCVTNQHKKSEKANVRVEVSGNGKAVQVGISDACTHSGLFKLKCLLYIYFILTVLNMSSCILYCIKLYKSLKDFYCVM